MGNQDSRRDQYGFLYSDALHLPAHHGGNIAAAASDRPVLPKRDDQDPPMVRLLVICWVAYDTMAVLRLSISHTQHWSNEKDQDSPG